MKSRPAKSAPAASLVFDAEGYQAGLTHLGGSPLPAVEDLRSLPALTPAQQAALGLPTSAAVARSLRGGARAGAGRKPNGKVKKTIKLSPRAILRVRTYAKRHGFADFSAAIEDLALRQTQ